VAAVVLPGGRSVVCLPAVALAALSFATVFGPPVRLLAAFFFCRHFLVTLFFWLSEIGFFSTPSLEKMGRRGQGFLVDFGELR
jgi:hypothetical protein